MEVCEIVRRVVDQAAVDHVIASYKADGDDCVCGKTGCQSRVYARREHYFREFILLRELLWPCAFISIRHGCHDRFVVESRARDLVESFASGLSAFQALDRDVVHVFREFFKDFGCLRKALKKDVKAAYYGDPAALSKLEVLRFYPSIIAMTVQRAAHYFWQHAESLPGLRAYARELCELMHQIVHIDLHPAVNIGEYFFIDHGTGVVIGETATIGSCVRIYQDVTLGTLHFEKDDVSQALKKGYLRHPQIGNHVVIGAGAKILGPVKVGNYVSIGANSWIQDDIEEGQCVYVSEFLQTCKKKKVPAKAKMGCSETSVYAADDGGKLAELNEEQVLQRCALRGQEHDVQGSGLSEPPPA